MAVLRGPRARGLGCRRPRCQPLGGGRQRGGTPAHTGSHELASQDQGPVGITARMGRTQLLTDASAAVVCDDDFAQRTRQMLMLASVGRNSRKHPGGRHPLLSRLRRAT